MKRILLIGDSIRLNYQSYVKDGLANEAEVVAPEENCQYAKYTLWGVNLWMNALGKPDIVHWNNGLWDVHHEAPMVEALTELHEYLYTLKRIANELKRTGAKIIFATTTPVAYDLIGRSNAEIDLYNAEAVKLLESEGIAINDLNAVIKQDMDKYICPDKVHLVDEGSKACADAVIKSIRMHLQKIAFEIRRHLDRAKCRRPVIGTFGAHLYQLLVIELVLVFANTFFCFII